MSAIWYRGATIAENEYLEGDSCDFCFRKAKFTLPDRCGMWCRACVVRTLTGQIRLGGRWVESRSEAIRRIAESKEWRDATWEPQDDGSVRVVHRSGATMTLVTA